MDYRSNKAESAAFLKGPQMRRVCTLAAAAWLSRARTLVGKETGRTAATGRLEHGYGGRLNDRVRVSVVFSGNAVQEQFGNRTRRASRFLTRAAP